jgi:putative endonuclease
MAGLLVMSVEKTYQVYVLQNTDGKFYIGLSADVAARLSQHNAGISNWTRSRGPWSLVWTSGPLSLSEARELENHLKKQKGGRGFYLATGLQRPSGS